MKRPETAQNNGSWRRMLEAVPVPNAAARVEDGPEPRELTVTVETTRPRWLRPPLSWIVPFRPERRTRLDRLGTRVWRLCDGQRTVEQVVDTFAEQYRLTFHEARVAVTDHLRLLIQRGILAIGLPPDPEAEEP
jgi:hypothetical protein